MKTRQHKAIHSHAKVQIVTFIDRNFGIYLDTTIKVDIYVTNYVQMGYLKVKKIVMPSL
jgi:hypothetical protein